MLPVRILLIVLVMLVGTCGAFAQRPVDPESRLAAMVRVLDPGATADDHGKCATSVMLEISRRWEDLGILHRREILSVVARPVMDTSRLSPGGRFRIHYDTVGVHEPALLSPTQQRIPGSREEYVDSVGSIFDQAWDLQIGDMGYDGPPSDGAQGGGPEYDVYIESQPAGVFGGTFWNPGEEFPGFPNLRYPTYIVIDNDYIGFRTAGLNGLRVTAAHEFHHAVQVGSYGIWTNVPNSDFYFYELTAVWMEHVAYRDIKDYIFDVGRYLLQFRDDQGRAHSFTHFSSVGNYRGYERSIFAHYLARRYGRDVLRDIWTGMRVQPMLRSVSEALYPRGSDMATAFHEFSGWTFFTADRSDTVRYFPEGHLYPRRTANTTMTYNGFLASFSHEAFPLSTQFYEFQTLTDTVTAIIVNADDRRAAIAGAPPAAFTLRMSSAPGDGASQVLGSGAHVMLKTDSPDLWRTLYLSAASQTDTKTKMFPAPNPLRLSEVPRLILPIEASGPEEAEVYVLSVSLDLIHSGRYPVDYAFGRTSVFLPTADIRSHVNSGVYFVVVRCGGKEYRWKVAMIR